MQTHLESPVSILFFRRHLSSNFFARFLMFQMETVSGNSEFVEEEKKEVAMGTKRLVSLRPPLALPPRNGTEAFLKGSDSANPSPTDQDSYSGDRKSFLQLLAGAIGSPTALSVPGNVSIHPSSFPLGSSNHPAAEGGPSSDGLPPRSSTARFKSMVPPRLPIPRSPYVLPPGLSPATLLESPVLLSSGLAEPSPTTGNLFLTTLVQDIAFSNGNAPGFGHDGSPTFIFKPYPQLPNSPLASMGPYGLSHQQALAQVQAQANYLVSGSAVADTPASEPASSMPLGTATPLTHHITSDLSVNIHKPMTGGSMESSEKVLTSSQAMVPALPLPHLIERPSDDGYNWRKYGQKQVKGSEYPRSYYKCTHPSCPMKKKVERSYEGQITEIIYKGDHNHARPQSTRRNAMSNAHTEGSTRDVSFLPTADRANASYELNKVDSDRSQRGGGLTGTPEPSLASTSDDEDEDGGDDDSGSKRIKLEGTREAISNPPLRTAGEPRVVLQTTSEVEILDDGYRWRKYGQKVVKGNPHPRSYYKCTTVGCNIRKHVERSSTDPNSVMTTYDGKHNHEVPAARNSNHETNLSAAAVIPAHPRPRANVWGTTEGRGATSLQEQLFGKLLEVADMEANKSIPKALMYNPSSSQGEYKPSQSGIMASASNLARVEAYYGQAKPMKSEDAHSEDVMPSAF